MMKNEAPSPNATLVASPSRTIKTTVKLPSEAVDTARSLAVAQHTTLAHVIHRSIGLNKVLSDATKSGARILIEEPDKSIKQLVLV